MATEKKPRVSRRAADPNDAKARLDARLGRKNIYLSGYDRLQETCEEGRRRRAGHAQAQTQKNARVCWTETRVEGG